MPNNKGMKKNIFWPEIDDLWTAKKACVQASSVALLIGIVTGVLAYLHLKGTNIVTGLSSTAFIDSAIFLALSFFIYRCSRAASLAGLVIYIWGQAMMLPQMHRASVSIIFFTLFLISGVRGAFAYHAMKKGLSAEEIKAALKAQREETDPSPSLKKRIIAWVILIGLIGGGYWFYTNYKKFSGHTGFHAVIQDAAPEKAPAAKSEPKQPPVPAKPAPGERIFKLKNGGAITGRVIADDPVYYTVETSGGRQEIVIKEDIVK